MLVFVVADAFLSAFTLWLALQLRFEGEVPVENLRMLALISPGAVAIVLFLGLAFGLYHSISRYASLLDMLRLSTVVGLTGLTVILGNEGLYAIRGARPLPLSVPIIWCPLLFVALGFTRILGRVRAHVGLARKVPVDAERVLIVGAGDAGEHIARDMLRTPHANLLPVGFVDDDPAKQGRKIHGLKVLGAIPDLAAVVLRTGADHVVVALPSAPSSVVRSVLSEVGESGAKAKILPSLNELMGLTPTCADIRDVDIQDLIGRKPININAKQIAQIFEARSVLITGAAGSIGSELARQALRFRPSRLLLLDNNETDLFLLVERLVPLAKSRGCEVHMLLADIRDRLRIDRVFEEYRPSLVLHAAAYKHVPVMELNPSESVITNITGTKNVALAARAHSTERMILVSTDKAVNPTSVMGASKRVAEMALSVIAAGSTTAFASVRFGNVLGSRGSVVPILAEQIRQGGPMTVTHPDATRYFMTISEASALICQAGAIAQGGETFVLEMGEPVRIFDLAERMKKLLASDNQDEIDIVITGLRAGEKLREDLWHEGETLVGRVQPGILKARPAAANRDPREVDEAIRNLERISSEHAQPAVVIEALFELVGVPGPSDESATITSGFGAVRPSG